MASFRELSADELRAHRETVLLRLLIRTAQIETGELIRRLHAKGHTNVQTSYIGLLGNIDTEGTRIVTIAERTGNTRQAVSQLAQAIEGAGYLERRPDPEDGRGVLVGHTAAGRALLADALEIMGEIEDGYADVIGSERMGVVKAALAEIAESTDPSSLLGRG